MSKIMANENKVIKSLNAQNYTGNYEVVSGKWNVSGTFNTDGQKQFFLLELGEVIVIT